MTWSWKGELEICRKAKVKGDIPGREKSNCKDLKEPGLSETAGVGPRVSVGERERVKAGKLQQSGTKVSGLCLLDNGRIW